MIIFSMCFRRYSSKLLVFDSKRHVWLQYNKYSINNEHSSVCVINGRNGKCLHFSVFWIFYMHLRINARHYCLLIVLLTKYSCSIHIHKSAQKFALIAFDQWQIDIWNSNIFSVFVVVVAEEITQSFQECCRVNSTSFQVR